MKSLEDGVRLIAQALDENLPKDVTFYLAMHHEGEFTIISTLEDVIGERVSFLQALINREFEAAKERAERQ